MSGIGKEGLVYPLTLSGGIGWNITSDSADNQWFQKFCGILGLTAGEWNPDFPRWNFIFNSKSDEYLSESCYHFLLWNVGIIYNTKTSEITCIFDKFQKGNVYQEYVRMSVAMNGLFVGIINAGGMFVHGALLRKDESGVLICAPGGTGKTTCANRVPHPWVAECDDTTILIPIGSKRYHAHPLPTWSQYIIGNHPSQRWEVQSPVPVRLICFLQQSDHGGIKSLAIYESAARLFQSAMQIFLYNYHRTQDEDRMRLFSNAVFSNACAISQRIPMFLMQSSRESPFWEYIDHELETLN